MSGSRNMLRFVFGSDASAQMTPKSLYERYYALAFSVAYQVLLQQQDAEDAVHNAFIGIMQHWEIVVKLPEEKKKTYVAMSAKNAAINISKQRRHISSTNNVQAYQEPHFPSLSPLAQGLREISEENREILLLRYDVGLTVKELAQHYGIKAAAVRQRLVRAKRALKDVMEEKDEAEI